MTEVLIVLVCGVVLFLLGFAVGVISGKWILEYEWKKEGNVVEKRQERQKDRDYILNGRPKNF
jgi:hypothetical protein